MKDLNIYIDPGHGGNDCGAVANNLVEAEVNLQVGLLLASFLDAQGVQVYLSREKDVAVSLEHRVRVANNLRPHLFLSLHCNAAESHEAKGLEVWTSPGQTASDAAADHIGKALQAAFTFRRFRADHSDGDLDKESPFTVLQDTTSPAVLVEMGFLTNAEEADWLRRISTMKEMALTLAVGVLGWAAATR